MPFMALRRKFCENIVQEFVLHRCYSSKVDLKKLRPMILKRIQNRANNCPIKGLIPVAQQVFEARAMLIHGVSTLLKAFPVVSCKFCPEVYVGEKGHLIRSCGGYKRGPKNQVHEWIRGGLNDVLVSVEAFHRHHMFEKVNEHDERLNFERVPAVVELCWQAGANTNDENLSSSTWNSVGGGGGGGGGGGSGRDEPLSGNEMRLLATETLRAWETVRTGVQKLLMVYPTKICKYCSDVHVGPSVHQARPCGVFKCESWRGSHFWEKADVDDLVPLKIVWHRRPQDPPVLVDEGRDYYGQSPAVLALCTQAGAIAPPKYHCMMKVQGLPPPQSHLKL
ncbi:APO protein 4, mitochondrial, partial [Cucurbita argyrosperma subsp. sororia]